MCVDGKSVLRPGQANNTTEPDFGHFAMPGQRGYVSPKRKEGVPASATQDASLRQNTSGDSSADQSTKWGAGWVGGVLK